MSRSTVWIAAAAALAVAWLAGRAFLARGTMPGHATAAVAVPAGEASPPSAADRIADPRVGARAAAAIPAHLPAFRLKTLAGQPESISKFAGRSQILNFWATWCSPCRREIPLLESIDRAWRARRFTVIGVAVDQPRAVEKFARRFKIGYPLMQGEQDALNVAASLGVASPVFPFTVFTDDRGELVALYLGELHRPQIEMILGIVSELNAHRIDLPAARRAIVAGLARWRTGRTTG